MSFWLAVWEVYRTVLLMLFGLLGLYIAWAEARSAWVTYFDRFTPRCSGCGRKVSASEPFCKSCVQDNEEHDAYFKTLH